MLLLFSRFTGGILHGPYLVLLLPLLLVPWGDVGGKQKPLSTFVPDLSLAFSRASLFTLVRPGLSGA